MANKTPIDLPLQTAPALSPPPITLTELPSGAFPSLDRSSYLWLQWLLTSFAFESHFKCHLLREMFPGLTSKVLSSITVPSPSYFLQLHSSQSVLFLVSNVFALYFLHPPAYHWNKTPGEERSHLFHWLLYPQNIVQCLTYGRCSMSKWMNSLMMRVLACLYKIIKIPKR